MRRRGALVAVALVPMLVAAGCDGRSDDSGTPRASSSAPASSTATTEPGVPRVSAVMPLPAEATIETSPPPSQAPTDDSCRPEATLRPVDVPPEKLVPGIRARGRVVVGLDQGSNPFSFRDPVSGQLTGFDVDLAREIARDIFGSPSQVEFRSLTSANRVQALEGRQVDLVIKSMSITCSRRRTVTFSAPYYQAYQRVLAVRGSDIHSLDDVEGRRVCVAAGTTSAQRLWQKVHRVTVLSVNTWADCLVAIQQGQVDAVTSDDAILAGLTAQDPYLQIVGPQIASEPYGVGIAASSPGNDTSGLVRQVNHTLERIRGDGTWTRMYSRWLSRLGPSPGMPAPTYAEEGER